MKKTLLTLLNCCIIVGALAQTNTFPSNGSAGIGTTTPNASATLDMVSSTKGLLIPRMTQSQRNAIVNPANGLTIYQTNFTKGFYYYDGSWKNIPNGRLYADSTNLAVGLNSLISDTLGMRNTAIGNYALFSNIGTDVGIQNGFDNTAVGFKALYANDGSNVTIGEGSAGSDNTAIGSFALYSNTESSDNTAIGARALMNQNSSSAWGNTAIGSEALFQTTSGGNNVAVGLKALWNSNSSSFNTAIGSQSLYSNTTGGYNTANGYSALLANTTGAENAAFGGEALRQNSTGNNNSAFGRYSLRNNNGSSNSAFGFHSLYTNTTGNYNSAFGTRALYSSTIGSQNTAIGYDALYFNTSGNYNTAVGYRALYNSTANYNTALGRYAGDSYDNGDLNTFLGYGADASSAARTNSSALGNGSRITASNQVRLGNASVTSIGGYVNWTNISDGRYKKNVKEDVIGLEFIMKLRPVVYNLDIIGINAKTDVKDEETDKESVASKEKIVYTGFIAQEVEKAAKEVGYDFSGVDLPKNEGDLYGIRYAEFTVPLVKAVQELSKQNEELKNEIQSLKNNLNKLEQKIASPSNNNYSNGFLGQNFPNPFNKNTTIPFVLPAKFTSAQIKLINTETGQIITVYQLTPSQTSQEVNINLANGIYSYSLIIDGVTIDSKQMINLK